MPERFPTQVAEVLRRAGWPVAHDADGWVAQTMNEVCNQVGRHGARIEPFAAAVAALAEFGGLCVMQDGPGRDLRRRPFALDPSAVAASAETLAGLSRLLGTRLFPIGMEGDHDTILAIDESGRVFAFDHAGTWHLGDTLDAALTAVITGTRPARIDCGGH